MPRKRIVYVHYHIYKNAGTTIDLILETNFGAALRFEAEDRNDSVHTGALLDVLHERPDVLYVSSHTLRPPRPLVAGYHFVDIVFLRHPIDRFRSIYDFSRANSATSDPAAIAARRFGLGDFAAWMADETPWNFFDPQTTFMGRSGDFFHPPTEEDLEIAKRRTLQVRFIGTVELFSESMRAANCYLRGVRPDIDLFPPVDPANVTVSRAQSLEQRIRQVREALGTSRFRRLEEALLCDFRLWEVATEEVKRRCRMCSGWVSR